MVESVMQLKCSCNNYPWGKKGTKSAAARLCAKTPGTDFKIDENKEYAEMFVQYSVD
jgi:mannose-6-phosphate isomerase